MAFRWLKKTFSMDKLTLLGAGLVITAFVCVLLVNNPRFLQFINNKIYDLLLVANHTSEVSPVPVIIDIDEKSLAEYGQWPWPRSRVALLLARLNELGVASVGLDILFAEPDRTSPRELKRQLKEEFQLDVTFQGLPEQLADNDALLAQVLGTGNFVLGYAFRFGHEAGLEDAATQAACPIPSINVALLMDKDAPDPAQVLYQATGVSCPLPGFIEAAPGCGFFNTVADEDGTLRRVPLVMTYEDRIYPSLALSSLMLVTGTSNLVLKVEAHGVESLRLGSIEIPLTERGEFTVNFRGGNRKYSYISAGDVLAGRVDPEAIQGRIAFIGTSAAGLKDLRATPFSQYYPGVETHATIVDNILTKDFLQRPRWARALQLVGVVLVGLLATCLLTWTTALWSVAPLLAVGAGMWFGTDWVFATKGFFVSPLYPFIALGGIFTVLTLLKFWREERQKRFIHGAFSHYLAPAVISQIMDDPDSLTLEGQEKDVTIQFSDVRSFTSLSERLTPTQVTNLLHDYLTPMTRIITDHKGTLDKFIGDAVMAFWNAPVDVPDHQRQAVQAAMEQLEGLRALNRDVFQEKYGFPIAVGIGIHCGTVRVGNMGSADLFDYTLIGDNVNLASRLEGLTKFYGQEIVVSEPVKEACGDAYEYQELDRVRVKGKEEPITIYTVFDHDEAAQRRDELDRYAEGLAGYRAMDFAAAGEVFARLRAELRDHPLYAMYQERCEHLAQEPPEDGWDGVFTHKTK